MTDPKITFRGWKGHFICADRCLFGLNTLIEYEDIKIVVSTIGLMKDIHNLNEVKFETIGLDRHFETMAFHAKKDKYLDADVQRQVYFDSPWCWQSIEDEQEANDGHYAVIGEICAKLKSGERFEVKP